MLFEKFPWRKRMKQFTMLFVFLLGGCAWRSSAGKVIWSSQPPRLDFAGQASLQEKDLQLPSGMRCHVSVLSDDYVMLSAEGKVKFGGKTVSRAQRTDVFNGAEGFSFASDDSEGVRGLFRKEDGPRLVQEFCRPYFPQLPESTKAYFHGAFGVHHK
jgi:hypothetical protein